jgi:predicted DNA-binding transcriptional regulator AlpA
MISHESKRRSGMPSELMNAAELGQRLSKSTAALANWRYLGLGPRFVKVGKAVRYRVSDVEAWLDQNTHQQSGAA